MSCTSPLYAIKLFDDKDGKCHIRFLSKSRVDYNYDTLCKWYGSDNVLRLPCGHCDSCLESRARSWAGRCVLEASCYDDNAFVTLTYQDSCLPKGGLCKKDIQRFLKRLRSRYPDKDIRYFICGEYGPKTFRPHYHLLIFNWFPEDAKLLLDNTDHPYFTSKILSSLWRFGFATLSFIDFGSCAYVARYCHKKVGKDLLKKHGYNSEFIMMSLKPGIGVPYFSEDIYETDKIYFPFSDKIHTLAPSKYFDKLLQRLDPSYFEAVKDQRISKANSAIASELLVHGLVNVEQLDVYKGDIKRDKMNKLVRKDL